jgi:hypothetical protein
MPYHRLCLRETYAALDVEYMGTLGEKQDKPIYAKASPRRWVIYWQQCHHGNEREPHQLEPYTMQLDTVEPIPCRYASHERAAHTGNIYTAHTVNRAAPLATMPDKPTQCTARTTAPPQLCYLVARLSHRLF